MSQKFLDLKADYIEYFNIDRHELAKEIEDNKLFTFEELLLLESQMSREFFPPLIQMSILSHPHCSIDYFKGRFNILKRNIGDVATNILSKTPCVADIGVVMEVLHINDTDSETLLNEFKYGKHVINNLAANKHLSLEIREKFLLATGDEMFMTEEQKEAFSF